MGVDPSDDELLAIVRRMEGQHKDRVHFEDLVVALDPVKVQVLDKEIEERKRLNEE